MARAIGIPYDVRKVFPYLGYETYDFDVPIGAARRRLRPLPGARRGDARRARRSRSRRSQRITPRGVYDIQDYRIVPPPKDKVYTEMEALIQHFLIYSQGFTVPAGEAYVPVEGPRGEHGFYIVSDGTNRPYRIKLRAPSFYACQALPKMIVGGHDRRRHRRHRLDRRRHGRRGSMSFHPMMLYGEGLPPVGARGSPTKGQPFTFTPERRAAARRDLLAKYPPERQAVGGAGGALSGAGAAGLSDRERACATSREFLEITPAEVEDVATYYVMFFKAPVGKYVLQVCRTLSCALAGRRARHRVARREARASRWARPTRPGCSRCSSSSASAPAIARRW